MFIRFMRVFSLLCMSFFLVQNVISAELDKRTPHERIELATTDLLTLIADAKGYFDNDPERFYRELSDILNPLVDFKSFTRSVMGDYGTRAYYQSLNKSQREQYKKDYHRFVMRFQEGLINTYGKGLLAFNGQKIVVEPATEEGLANVAAGNSVDVIQHIQGSEKNFTATYKMSPNKKGVWLLRNVSIGSINVGQLYRNQFAAAMDKNKGDFSAVIDAWVVEAKDLEEETEQESVKQ